MCLHETVQEPEEVWAFGDAIDQALGLFLHPLCVPFSSLANETFYSCLIGNDPDAGKD